jgi:hypothetical protein
LCLKRDGEQSDPAQHTNGEVSHVR